LPINSRTIIHIAIVLSFQKPTFQYNHSESKYIIFIRIFIYNGLLGLDRFALFRGKINIFQISIVVHAFNISLRSNSKWIHYLNVSILAHHDWFGR
jgi:hypothetical protein